MALQLFFWDRDGNERVEEQPLEAIGVAGDWPVDSVSAHE
jgi:hypothetical protein